MSVQGNDFDAGAFNAQAFDCGDGVPALIISNGDAGAGFDSGGSGGLAATPEPKISIRIFALAASVLTQILIGLIVAVGGNAVVGIFAAITVVTCSLILVIAEASDTN
jgi:hypothetical protein